MTEQTLIINMLGEFSIKNEYYQFTHIGNKSLQITRLLSYLIANKELEISKDKLIDVLWPEDSVSNPSGALRNLIYRARAIITQFFPNQSDPLECVLFSQGAYRWNPEIDCIIDIYQFENYIQLASKEQDSDIRFSLESKAHGLYKDDFLNILSSDEWVIFRNVYYKNLYTKITLSMCRYLSRQNRYAEVIRLCEASSLVDQMDEQLHLEKLDAYLNMDAPTQALSYYYSVSDLFVQKLGIGISAKLRAVYDQIIRQLPNPHQDLSNLEKNLRGEGQDNSTFYCNFDIFKNIYQINLRSVRRSQSKRYLVLFTLSDLSNETEITTDIISEMQILYAVLTKHLRSNDVFTKSSPTQYSLILTVANENGCHSAIARIRDRFNKLHQYPQVEMDIDYKLIQ